MSDSRSRFEAWYASPAYPMTRPIGWHTHGFRQNHGEYWVGEIQEEWLTWQAGQADGRAEAAKRCIDLIAMAAVDPDISERLIEDIKAEFPEAFK